MFDVDTATSTTADEPPQGLLAGLFKEQTKKFTVEILNEDDIRDFLLLQKKAWKNLAHDEKHYLKIRTRDDLLTHMSHRMPIIGVKDENGFLVGQCLLSYPCRGDAVKNIVGYPLSENLSTTAIIQSVAVDPAMRGHGLARQMIDSAKEIAAMSDHVVLLAKVADDNTKSGKSFMNADFTAAAIGKDPVKGYPVTYYVWNPFKGCDATLDCVAK